MSEPEIDRFHEHLDECKRCRDKPFDLCPVGGCLLEAAGRVAFGTMPLPPGTKVPS